MRVISLDEFIEMYSRLPDVLGKALSDSPKQEVLVRFVREKCGFSEEQIKQFFRTYIATFFREVSIYEFLEFFSQQMHPSLRTDLIRTVLDALYEYGNFVPDIQQCFEKYHLPLPNRQPMVKEGSWEKEMAQRGHGEPMPYVHITLSKAMEKYPKILYQMITSNDILMRGSTEMVKPTLKNWITVYHQELGAGMHDALERGNFLHQQRNTTVLSQEERDHLADIFKSLDESSMLFFDEKTQKIVFPDRAVVEKPLQAATLYYDENGTIVGNVRIAPANRGTSVSSEASVQEQPEYASQSVFVPTSRPVHARQPERSVPQSRGTGFTPPNFLGGGANTSQDGLQRGSMFGGSGALQSYSAHEKKSDFEPPVSVSDSQKQSASSALRFSSPQRLPGEQSENTEEK